MANLSDILKKNVKTTRPYTKLSGMTAEEKKEHEKKLHKGYLKKYQQTSEHYKEYIRMKVKKALYSKMEDYINEYTDDVVEDILDFDLSSKDLRIKFKETYGNKIYYKYISEHSQKNN